MRRAVQHCFQPDLFGRHDPCKARLAPPKTQVKTAFDKGIIHAECVGGDIDLLLNQRAVIGCYPWRFVDGESSIARIVAHVEDDRYEELMKKKAKAELTRFGDVAGAKNPWLHEEARKNHK